MLLGLALIETSASVILQVGRTVLHSERETRYRAEVYAGVDWAVDYFRELESLRTRWASYVEYETSPLSGRYINVDGSGVRRTWRSPSPPTMTILMFGGSTLWGTGARDDHTIPSEVARQLWVDHGIAASVVNLGVTGYVSTQELVKLSLELDRGAKPDLVVFYDGVNDVYSAYQNGVAGLPQNEDNRRREFGLSSPGNRPELVAQLLSPTSLRATATFQLFEAVTHRVLGRAPTPPTPTVERVPQQLGAEAAARYAENVEHIRRVTRDYGVKALFFWQPSIFDKPSLTPYEAAARDEYGYLAGLFRAAGGAVDADARLSGDFRDLRTLFAREGAPLFIDFAHLGEAGNERIAREIASAIQKATRAP